MREQTLNHARKPINMMVLSKQVLFFFLFSVLITSIFAGCQIHSEFLTAKKQKGPSALLFFTAFFFFFLSLY